jgi:hypothetical protein
MVKFGLILGLLISGPAWAEDDVYADYPIRIQVQGEPVSFANNLQCVGVKGQLCVNDSYCGWFACRKTDEETK